MIEVLIHRQYVSAFDKHIPPVLGAKILSKIICNMQIICKSLYILG